MSIAGHSHSAKKHSIVPWKNLSAFILPFPHTIKYMSSSSTILFAIQHHVHYLGKKHYSSIVIFILSLHFLGDSERTLWTRPRKTFVSCNKKYVYVGLYTPAAVQSLLDSENDFSNGLRFVWTFLRFAKVSHNHLSFKRISIPFTLFVTLGFDKYTIITRLLLSPPDGSRDLWVMCTLSHFLTNFSCTKDST